MDADDVIRIHSFDGQTVWFDPDTELLEVGNFLGGGAAGTVYECEHMGTHEHFALKILTPLGYKLLTSSLLRRCNVLTKGKPVNDLDRNHDSVSIENVWWLLNNSTRQYIAAYYSEKLNSLKELSLSQCIQVWGTSPPELEGDDGSGDQSFGDPLLPAPAASPTRPMQMPKFPTKFVEFVRRRNRIFREIRNMRKVSNHRNIIRLEGVLELVQDSKCTIFLLLELANGGELFDRIKIDCGTREETAKFFFKQLLLGVKHCHDQGVCHRDLKPENLLLQDIPGNAAGTILKIADFGFSARFAMPQEEVVASQYYSMQNNAALVGSPSEQPRILKSVVGSPFYVAPEVISARGYDGTKADVWSLGVILYAMLAGNLPFSQELAHCKRFSTFCKWIKDIPLKGTALWFDQKIEYPSWLFPANFSASAKGLIISMLHPDPGSRITVAEAMTHPLCEVRVVQPGRDQSDGPNRSRMPPSGVNAPFDSMAEEREQEDVSAGEKILSMETDNDHDDRSNGYDEDDIFHMDDDEEEDDYGRDHDPALAASPHRSVSGSQESAIAAPHNLHPHHLHGQQQQQQYQYQQGWATSGNGTSTRDADYGSGGAAGTLNPFFPPPPPPMAPHLSEEFFSMPRPIDDLLVGGVDDASDTSSHPSEGGLGDLSNTTSSAADYYRHSHAGSGAVRFNSVDSTTNRNVLGNNSHSGSHYTNQPPSSNDLVKRSTRFITAVPAMEVLQKVNDILQKVKVNHASTPLGSISKVELDRERYKLEVWGVDTSGPSLCSLHVYQLPSYCSVASSPDRTLFMSSLPASLTRQQQEPFSLSMGSNSGFSSSSQELFLVEFVRGQIEIFAFKRFYQWVRQSLSTLVKRDYAIKIYDQAYTPS